MHPTLNSRTLLIALITIIAFLSGACVRDDDPETDKELVVGQTMPQFEVVTTTGDTISTASLKGHVSVIVLFSTTCPDCRRQLPELQDIYTSLPTDATEWICIARQDMNVIQFWDKTGLTMPVSPQPDRTVYDLFASVGIPRAYVFDRDGVLYASFGGMTDINTYAFSAAIKRLVNQ